MRLQVTTLGDSGPTVILVHGSLNDGSTAFTAQAPLAQRWRLVIPNRRGYGNSPATDKVDVEVDAADIVELLGRGGGGHLVGTSMGGIVVAHAAARAPALVHSLTLIEPPAFVNAIDIAPVAETAEAMKRHWQNAAHTTPAEFIPGFLQALGITIALPSPMPPSIITAARNLMTEAPWDCSIPAAELASAPFPKLIISGTSCPAFEAICDRIAGQLGAVRRVFDGAGHAVQRLGAPFNELLEAFMSGR
ncbi:MAG TPA: alpha/beta hydrolase [Candidatus Binataceae bacterium]|nr:alpha/beta hydrolase [Candidatus Binataceae bacterium]